MTSISYTARCPSCGRDALFIAYPAVDGFGSQSLASITVSCAPCNEADRARAAQRVLESTAR